MLVTDHDHDDGEMTSIRLLRQSVLFRFTSHHPSRPSPFRPQARTMSLASSSPQLTRSSEIPKTRSILLRTPTAQDLEEQELDVDIIPNGQVNLVLTDRAAEVRHPQTPTTPPLIIL